MALTLLFEDNSAMFMDVVTNYSKGRSSNISNHPIDSASVISDHVSKNNPVFTIRGLISAADFHSTDQRDPQLLDSTDFTIDNEYNTPVDGAEISQRSNLLDFLPGSIQQFLGSTNPSTVSLDEFRGYSHQAARDKIERAWENSERITLLDYDYDLSTGRSVSVRSFTDLIIERYDDNETVDTGDSLEFTLTFRKIRIAYIKEIDVQINQQPSSAISDETAAENNRGDQSGDEETAYFADFVESSSGLGITDITDYIPGLQ